MSDGSRQDRRCPPALVPGSVPVDARSLPDLVAAAVSHAQSLGFRDAAGHPVGTWGRLFEHDESAVLASGLAIDATAAEQAFLDNLVAGRGDAAAKQIDALSVTLADWLAALAEVEDGQASAVVARIERQIAPLLPTGWRDLLAAAATPAAQREHFFALLEALHVAQARARDRFAGSLASGTQSPSAALLLVCVQVYRRIQSRLNDFQARHLDFYYRDVLQLQPRAAVSDAVHLVFRRDPKYAQEVVVAAGQVFAAGKTPAGLPIRFAAVEGLTVTDAAVADVRMLRFDRNDQVAPENALSFVTSAESRTFDNTTRPMASSPLFGVASGGAAARLGLAVASPILWLAQGDRALDVMIEMDVGPLPALIDAFTEARTARHRREALGRLAAHWLFCDTMTEADVETIRAAWDSAHGSDDIAAKQQIADDAFFAQFLPPRAAGNPAEDVAARRALARDALVATLFTCELSTAVGWFRIDSVSAVTRMPVLGREIGGLGLRMALKPEDPAIVACTPAHGSEWPAHAPVLRLRVNPDARIFALSLLDNAVLRAIRIGVEVGGVNDLEIVNQYGQLDPSKPFEPFGPVPDPASYLVVGSAEAARKSVVKFDLALDWVGLPETGLAAHYDAYGGARGGYADADFRMLPSLLRGGRWLKAPPQCRMFDTDAGGKALPHQVVRVDRATLARSWLASEVPIVFDQRAVNGLVKFELAGPRHCFGHADYPGLLVAAMRVAPRHKMPLPHAPYTPRLARIALDYAATTRIQVGADTGNEAILHLHPFGIRTIHPVVAGHVPSVVPRFDGDGQLLIGIAAETLGGELSLLFELDADSAGPATDRLSQRRAPIWSWLAGDSWTALARSHVLADTTQGFLSSGIVKLNLPAGPTKGNSILPADLFWLRVSSELPSRSFAGLRRISAQATVAQRVVDPVAAFQSPLPPGTITTRSATVAGVLGIEQPEGGFGLRLAETPSDARTRLSERLRHRRRAATAWDYERLVLEAFPMVFKAKCLPNLVSDCDAEPGDPMRPVSGAVLVVVVPALEAAQRLVPRMRHRPLRLPADVLEQIEAYLQALSSPHARVRVINATYEFIQVRCSVDLAATDLRGTALTRVSDAITRYLSPWSDTGLPPDFEWHLRGPDIEACVRAVDAVQSVGELSIMRVWEDDRPGRARKFRLDDTGRNLNALCRSDAISACRPWSLMLPFDDHIVMLTHDESEGPGVPTGIAASTLATPSNLIAGLEIGETMIL